MCSSSSDDAECAENAVQNADLAQENAEWTEQRQWPHCSVVRTAKVREGRKEGEERRKSPITRPTERPTDRPTDCAVTERTPELTQTDRPRQTEIQILPSPLLPSLLSSLF